MLTTLFLFACTGSPSVDDSAPNDSAASDSGSGDSADTNDTDAMPPADHPEPTSEDRTLAQKGPFVIGTEVTAKGISADGQETGELVAGVVFSDFGHVYLRPMSSPWAWITIDGSAFHEMEDSYQPAKVEGLVRVTADGHQGNLNVFSQLTSARALAIGGDLELAWTQARIELWNEFDATGDPHHSDVLARHLPPYLADQDLVLYTSALLSVQRTQHDATELILADFADDGQINGVAEAVNRRVLAQRTFEVYSVGRDNILHTFADAPPYREWPYPGSGLDDPCPTGTLCDGSTVTLTGDAKGWFSTPLFVERAGSFRLQGNFHDFNNFNQVQLTDAQGTSVSLGNGNGQNSFVTVTHYDAGQQGAAAYFSGVGGTVELTLERFTDGSISFPMRLPIGIPVQGSVGQKSGVHRSFYQFDEAPEPTFNLRNFSGELTITAWTQDAFVLGEVSATPMGTATGGAPLMLTLPNASGPTIIRVENAAPNQSNGTTPYEIEVY